MHVESYNLFFIYKNQIKIKILFAKLQHLIQIKICNDLKFISNQILNFNVQIIVRVFIFYINLLTKDLFKSMKQITQQKYIGGVQSKLNEFKKVL